MQWVDKSVPVAVAAGARSRREAAGTAQDSSLVPDAGGRPLPTECSISQQYTRRWRGADDALYADDAIATGANSNITCPVVTEPHCIA